MTSLLGAGSSSRQTDYPAAHVIEGFNLDGVEIARLRKHRRGLPWRQIYLFVLAVLAFKIALFFNIGAANYGGMVDGLLQGGTLERLGGILLTLDPLSEMLVQALYNPRF